MDTFQKALKDYLDREGNDECALADKVKRSQAAINRYRHGKRFPDADTAQSIHEQTGGEVSFALWKSDFLARSGIAA